MSGNDAIDNADAFDDCSSRIDECIALMEMAWRTKEANAEDFRMLQQVCFVTFERLNNAKSSLLACGARAGGSA